MNWREFLVWMSDPGRTHFQLVRACEALHLDLTGNITDLRNRLWDYARTQNLDDLVPPALEAVILASAAPTPATPPGPPAPAPAPAPTPAPSRNPLWFVPVGLGVILLLLLGALAYQMGNPLDDIGLASDRSGPSDDNRDEDATDEDEPTTPTTQVDGDTDESDEDSMPLGSSTTDAIGQPASNSSQGSWQVTKFRGHAQVDSAISKLRNPDPAHWKVFPNVPNPDVSGFRVANDKEVPDGAEYGQDDSPFCEQDMRCDFVVPSWHYRLITGDYKFQGMTCSGGPGCLLLLINVGDKSFTWRNQSVDNGFTVMGRFWNGDALEWASWGLVSHASANMLNMATWRNPNTGDVLNAGPSGSNAGANCGNPKACNNVDVTIVYHNAGEILSVAKTTVNR